MSEIRMYNLEGRSVHELQDLRQMVQTHPSLTPEEKEANLKAIEVKLGVSCSKNKELLRQIEEGQADISDMGGI